MAMLRLSWCASCLRLDWDRNYVIRRPTASRKAKWIATGTCSRERCPKAIRASRPALRAWTLTLLTEIEKAPESRERLSLSFLVADGAACLSPELGVGPAAAVAVVASAAAASPATFAAESLRPAAGLVEAAAQLRPPVDPHCRRRCHCHRPLPLHSPRLRVPARADFPPGSQAEEYRPKPDSVRFPEDPSWPPARPA